MLKITNDRLNPVCHRMLHSCTHMATVGVEGLKLSVFSLNAIFLVLVQQTKKL